MTLRVLLVIAGLARIAISASADPGALLAEGNALYRDGDFPGAAQAYTQALELGGDGASVRYNLANALHRSERTGEAIAQYLAAARMAPRDRDIRSNLLLALNARPAGAPVPPTSWLHAAMGRLVGAFTLSEFAVAATVAYWIALACVIGLLVGRGKRRRLRRVSIAAGIAALVLTALAVGRWWGHHHVERAVVAVETTEMRTGPGESFEVSQPVGEGWIVRVLRDDTSWMEVVDEADVRGWLRADAVARVTLTPPDIIE